MFLVRVVSFRERKQKTYNDLLETDEKYVYYILSESFGTCIEPETCEESRWLDTAVPVTAIRCY